VTDRYPVTFHSPGPDAYRVRIVGESPTDVETILLVGARTQTVMLAPGPYLAFFEGLSEPRQARAAFNVEKSEERHVDLADYIELGGRARPNFKPARTSRPDIEFFSESLSESLSILPELVRQPASISNTHGLERGRRFSIGLSYDSEPAARGKWAAGAVPFELLPSGSDRLELQFFRPADWTSRPRWRLTVAMDGEQAIRVPLPFFDGGLRVSIKPAQTARGADISVELAPTDPATNTMMAGMGRAAQDEAAQLIDNANVDTVAAIEALDDKAIDPWAAAAAALHLVKAPGVHEKTDRWTRNLAERFPWLPDASVAAAWAEASLASASRADVECDCLQRLLDARKIGAPYFSVAVPLALELLRALARSAEDPVIRQEARYQQSFWSRYGRRSLRAAPYLIWEHVGSGLKAGKLPSTYGVLGEGRLFSDAIKFNVQSLDPYF
jgi:hypothetical protein